MRKFLYQEIVTICSFVRRPPKMRTLIKLGQTNTTGKRLRTRLIMKTLAEILNTNFEKNTPIFW